MTIAELLALLGVVFCLAFGGLVVVAYTIVGLARLWNRRPVRARRRSRPGLPHNVFAHPLLVLVPPVGEWIHERTEPVVPTWRERAARRRLPVVKAAPAGWSHTEQSFIQWRDAGEPSTPLDVDKIQDLFRRPAGEVTLQFDPSAVEGLIVTHNTESLLRTDLSNQQVHDLHDRVFGEPPLT